MLMPVTGVVLLLGLCAAAWATGGKSPYAAWSRGPSADPSFFPIGVCTQDPVRAKEYRALGINTYLSIWDGPSDDQMQQLHEAGMTAMCEPDDWGGKAWAHREDPAITGWIQVDEPDNAQTEEGGGYGKAIPPERIMAAYEDLRRRDPTRPVVLCLGQGVANDEWVGRGCEMSDYPKYAQACDILMYDVYPVVNTRKPDGENYLWYVAKGLDRLREWSGGKKIIWNAIECTHISNPDKKATPHQVKAEVWMSLVHGSMGIMYFVHQFKPTFVEAGLLIDPEMMSAVKAINQQILSLAPVLNSPTVEGVVSVTSASKEVPIDVMVKRQGEITYVFSAGMRNARTRGRFEVKGLPGKAVAEVLGEGRTIRISGGKFEDDFGPYDVHLYRIAGRWAPLRGPVSRAGAMTSRERVLAAIRRQPVDYAPCSPLVNPLLEVQRRGKPWNFPWSESEDATEYLVTVLGTGPVVGDWWLEWFFPEPSVTSRTWREGPVLRKAYETPSGVLQAAVLGNELWPFGREIPFFHDFLGHYTEPWLKTEADLECLKHILLPPRTQEQLAQTRARFQASKAKADRFQLATVATVGSGLTSALWMFGAQNLGLLVVDNPALVQAYLAREHRRSLRMIEILLDCGVDVIQRSGFYETSDYYSPAMLERLIGEAVREEIELTHQGGRPYSYILYSGLMPMLDYLAPLEFDCVSSLDTAFDNVDLAAVNAKLGDRKSFRTGPSNTFHMYADDPAVVRRAVQEVFAVFGKVGLLLSACSSVHPMMPWENTLAMVDEWKKLRYGVSCIRGMP